MGVDMAETVSKAVDPAPKRDWRTRETRKQVKRLAKRVTADEHQLVNWYVDQIGSDVAEQLAPAVNALIERARAHRESMLAQETAVSSRAIA